MLGERVSYRRLIGMTDDIPEADYSLLVRVPELLNLSPELREALLDIETEQLRLTHQSRLFTVTVRSLGHSQHASPDFTGGKRFGARTTVLVFPDLGSEAHCWYQGIEICLKLFQAGSDVIWLDIDRLRSDPSEWCKSMQEILPQTLSILGVSKFNSLGFGFGGGFVLNQLSLSQGKHVCVRPRLTAPPDSIALTAELRTANYQLWVLGDEATRWLEGVAAMLRRSREGRRFDPLTVTFSEISDLEIPGDSLQRRIFKFEKTLEYSIAQFFEQISRCFRNPFQSCFSAPPED